VGAREVVDLLSYISKLSIKISIAPLEQIVVVELLSISSSVM